MIRNIWGVGRNYASHAREMGQTQSLNAPMIFLKAGSSALREPTELLLPEWSQEVHYETEMAVQLDEKLAPAAVGIALDLTERNFQNEAKQAGHPWTLAKSFIGACPLGPLVKPTNRETLSHLDIELRIQGEVRQSGNTSDMIYSTLELLSYLKKHFPICPGDLILTGTPEGVGALHSGDEVEARLGEVSRLSFKVL